MAGWAEKQLATRKKEGDAVPVADVCAVIDLGSNSFRLELARAEGGEKRRLLYCKETIRLGAGLDEEKNLTPEALRNGWDCLRRFAQVLAEQRPARIRAVATQTLREAQNAAEFQRKAEKILGCPLHIISGGEEARLIYQGACTRLPDASEERLVIDIGGRSTEVILGQGRQARVLQSFAIGAVSASLQHFAQGRFSAEAFAQARAAAVAVFAPALAHYPRTAWRAAYGSAGTINAVSSVLQGAGLGGDVIHLEHLHWLQERLIHAGSVKNLQLAKLKEDRKALIGGGLSVLLGLFEAFEIETLTVTSGALRDGVFAELSQC